MSCALIVLETDVDDTALCNGLCFDLLEFYCVQALLLCFLAFLIPSLQSDCTALYSIPIAQRRKPGIVITNMHHDNLSNLPFGRVGTHSGNGQLMGLQIQPIRYPDETICLCRYENDRNGIR